MFAKIRFERKEQKVLHQEGNWKLLDATENRFNAGPLGWQSVIRHDCPKTKGSPYWMLLECSTSLTICTYCKEDIPVGIVGLFKLQNWERIRP